MRFAVEEAIQIVNADSPGDPAAQLNVVVDVAVGQFNQLERSTDQDLGFRSAEELESKVEVEAEKQLGVGGARP